MKWFESKGPRNLVLAATSVVGIVLGNFLYDAVKSSLGLPLEWGTVVARIIGSSLAGGGAYLGFYLWEKRKANRSDSI
jgi:hypothetical protein